MHARFCLSIICLFVLIPLFSFAQTNHQSIYISEVNWSGSSRSSSDEWIELHNPGQDTVDLSTYGLRINSNSGVDEYLLTSNILPGEYFVISGYGDQEKSSLLEKADLVLPAISLSNTIFKIELISKIDEVWHVVDMAGDGAKPLAGSTKPYASMLRQISPQGELLESWLTANVSSGFKDPIDLGTPGEQNQFLSSITDFTCDSKYLLVQIPDHLVCRGVVLSLKGGDGTIVIDSDGWMIEEEYTGGIFSLDVLITPEEVGGMVVKASVKNGSDSYKEVRVPVVMFSDKILINEILPNTNAGEWVEIKNDSAEPVDLYGWSLDDSIEGGSKPYYFDNQTKLRSGEYRKFELASLGIILNNDHDRVNIINPAGMIVHNILYTSTQKNKVYARQNERLFTWTDNATPETENLSDPSPPFSESIHFSEVYPDPEGRDDEGEWVELFNSSETLIDLSGWVISDTPDSSTGYTIDSGQSVPAFGYYVLSRPKSRIVLNNTGDTLHLFSPDGKGVATLEYYGAKEGWSYANLGNSWEWTLYHTPGNENQKTSIDTQLSEPLIEGSISAGPQHILVDEEYIIIRKSIRKPVLLASIEFRPIDVGETKINGKVLGVSSKRDVIPLPYVFFSGIIICLLLTTISLWLQLRHSINSSYMHNNSPPR